MVTPPAPSSDASSTPARASASAVVGVLAAVGLMLVLLTWAASIGPEEVYSGGNVSSYDAPTPTPSYDNTDAGVGPGDDTETNDLVGLIITLTAAVLGGVLVLAAALNLLRWLLTRNWRRHRDPEPAEIEFHGIDVPSALPVAVASDAPAQFAALASGTPRNGIVACWHRFEETAAGAGVTRRRSETSAEFTIRVLDELAADPAAVSTLAELYREARHSEHEVTEQTRASARDALDAIHRSLGVGSRSP